MSAAAVSGKSPRCGRLAPQWLPIRRGRGVPPRAFPGIAGIPAFRLFPPAMFLHPAIAAIITAARERWWRLPEHVSERRRQRRNAYMRDYMRAYRQETHSLSPALSDQERHRLVQEAQAVGRNPTACFRDAAFAYFDRRLLLPKAYEDRLAEAIGEIRRVGNNINQLAHHANARRKTTHREMEEARRLLTALEADVSRLLTPPPLPAAPSAPDGVPPAA